MKTFTKILRDNKNINLYNHVLKIYEADLCEMTQVGFMEGSKRFEVYVRTNDGGNIPHVHVRSTDGSFETCIELTKSEYFHHGGKYEDEFNSKERKLFNEFMHSTSKNKRYSTNYEYACSMWNDNNSNITIDENHSIPNYINL